MSVFFTLSGYLITSLALVEHDRTGRLDVGAFYARRVRRLLPASLACLAGVVVLAWSGVFDDVDHLRRDLWAAFAQVYNWVALASGQSYADLVAGGDGRPLAARPLLVAGDRGAVLLGVAAGHGARAAGRSATAGCCSSARSPSPALSPRR